jgi:hypothetical protein
MLWYLYHCLVSSCIGPLQPTQTASIMLWWHEVLTAVTMKMAVFWVVAPCGLVWVYRRRCGRWGPSPRPIASQTGVGVEPAGCGRSHVARVGYGGCGSWVGRSWSFGRTFLAASDLVWWNCRKRGTVPRSLHRGRKAREQMRLAFLTRMTSNLLTKRWVASPWNLTHTSLHGATTQKTAIFNMLWYLYHCLVSTCTGSMQLTQTASITFFTTKYQRVLGP